MTLLVRKLIHLRWLRAAIAMSVAPSCSRSSMPYGWEFIIVTIFRQWRYRCRRQIRVESFYRNFPATLSLLPPDRDVFPPISGRGTAGAGHCQHVVSPRVADVPGTCNFDLLGLPFPREAGIASCERLTSRAACLPTTAGILGGNTITSSA